MKNFKTLAGHCGCAGPFESYLVTNPEDRFSREVAHIILMVGRPVWVPSQEQLVPFFNDFDMLQPGIDPDLQFPEADTLPTEVQGPVKKNVVVTWHNTTPSPIILTLSRPVLALPRKPECQARSS